ncbi:hypothetical protein DC60_30920 [Streptomyces wadayamensis]|uniref:Uncharacterized protein n=1 Tax=Streptomyces wadayamensis TaxID=141454 RepID=A0ABR4SFX2_9ACTN|nr:hypothetical protein DC60_30920 [Streptomyces wadayamensis]
MRFVRAGAATAGGEWGGSVLQGGATAWRTHQSTAYRPRRSSPTRPPSAATSTTRPSGRRTACRSPWCVPGPPRRSATWCGSASHTRCR